MAWTDKLRKVEPYVPGEQPREADLIKLNTNENPYPPAPGVLKAMQEFTPDKLRLYPDPTSHTLISALAEFYNRAENEIFVGIGSDDVLAVAFMAVFNSDKPILFPDITYSFYDVWAELFRIPYEKQPLGPDFRIRREDYYKENGGIVIANPNAPTSICENLDFIEDILRHNEDSVVIVDEAYIDFGGESAMKLIDKYENLLIVQTFSKARSMAGMRVGYAIGNSVLIKALNDVKYSFNSYTMNQPSLYYAAEAVRDADYFYTNIKKVIKTREWTKDRLRELGFDYLDSKTNFIFMTHEKCAASYIFSELRKANILVRHFDKPVINNYLRMSIGTDEQMKKVIEELDKIIKSQKEK